MLKLDDYLPQTPINAHFSQMSPAASSSTPQSCVVQVLEEYDGDVPVLSPRNPLPFPWKLHSMLEWAEKEHLSHIVSWDAKGKSFKVHDKALFATRVMSRWFHRQSKYRSFQRQLNIWGFKRIGNLSSGGYYHIHFRRDDKTSFSFMIRSTNQKSAQSHTKPDAAATKRSMNQPEALSTLSQQTSDGTAFRTTSFRSLSSKESSEEFASRIGTREQLDRYVGCLVGRDETIPYCQEANQDDSLLAKARRLSSAVSNEEVALLLSSSSPSSSSSSLDRWKYIKIGISLAASEDRCFKLLFESLPTISSNEATQCDGEMQMRQG